MDILILEFISINKNRKRIIRLEKLIKNKTKGKEILSKSKKNPKTKAAFKEFLL